MYQNKWYFINGHSWSFYSQSSYSNNTLGYDTQNRNGKIEKKLEIDRPDRRRSNISFPFSSFSFVQTNCAKRNFHETEVAFETFDGHGAIEVCEKQTAGEGGGGSSLFNY